MGVKKKVTKVSLMGQFYPDPENNRIDEKNIFYWILSHLSTEHTKFFEEFKWV